MNVPKYVLKKMTFRERWRVFLLKHKLKRSSKKLGKYVIKAHKYEDLMYKYDEKLCEIIDALKIRYV